MEARGLRLDGSDVDTRVGGDWLIFDSSSRFAVCIAVENDLSFVVHKLSRGEYASARRTHEKVRKGRGREKRNESYSTSSDILPERNEHVLRTSLMMNAELDLERLSSFACMIW